MSLTNEAHYWTFRHMRWYDWVVLVIMTVVPVIGGFIGGIIGDKALYSTIKLPSFAPPSWVFAPAWTVIYLLMGFASYIVWATGDWQDKLIAPSLVLYLLQLLLNWVWSPLFFGGGLFAWALLDITAVWAFTVATLATFVPQSAAASLLLVPYVLWLSYATALTFSILCLNGCVYAGN